MTERTCNLCQKEYPLTVEFWHKDSSRPSGFMYTCKDCEKSRGKSRYKLVPNKYKLLFSQEQKENKKTWSRAYTKTESGRAVVLASAYRKIDKAKGLSSEVTAEFMLTNIFSKSCEYCGETGYLNLGCDRVDNSKGHTIANVVPCCTLCNLTRMAQFTYAEMRILGETIKAIKKAREKTEGL